MVSRKTECTYCVLLVLSVAINGADPGCLARGVPRLDVYIFLEKTKSSCVIGGGGGGGVQPVLDYRPTAEGKGTLVRPAAGGGEGGRVS